MTATEDWDQIAETHAQALRPPRVSAEIEGALVAYFTREPSDYDDHRLHYGSDLDPSGCHRKTWYRLRGAQKDAPKLGDEIRFHGGRVWESAALDAIEATGVEVRRQVEIRPLRPSAWAWVGHADAVLVGKKHLLEIKAPRAAYFERAAGDPKRLVKQSYAWQASSYFHELRRVGRVETASFLFLDREGSHAPIEVSLDDFLVPLERIVEEETERARLLSLETPPLRAAGSVVVEVLKGGRKTKANPTPERVVRATEHRYALCSYCPYQGVCQPGPEEREVAFESGSVYLRSAIAQAEEAWSRGDKKTPQVVRFGADELEDEKTPQEAPPPSIPPQSFPPAAAGSPSSDAVALYTGPAIMKEGETVRVEPPETPPTKAERAEDRAALAASMLEIEERATRGESSISRDDAPSVGW